MLHEILLALLGQTGGVIKNKGDGLKVSSSFCYVHKMIEYVALSCRPRTILVRMFRPSAHLQQKSCIAVTRFNHALYWTRWWMSSRWGRDSQAIGRHFTLCRLAEHQSEWIYLHLDSGYLHDGRADKNPYPHDRRADKDSYSHDSNNQCIILRLQLSFVMINVQLMLV